MIQSVRIKPKQIVACRIYVNSRCLLEITQSYYQSIFAKEC